MSHSLKAEIEKAEESVWDFPYWMLYGGARPKDRPTLGDLVAYEFQADNRKRACVYRVVAMRFDERDDIVLDLDRLSDGRKRHGIAMEAVSICQPACRK